MPLKDGLVREVLHDLTTGDEGKQAIAAQHIRSVCVLGCTTTMYYPCTPMYFTHHIHHHSDLCSNSEHYRALFSTTDVVGALCGLLDDSTRKAAPLAAHALAMLAVREDDRTLIRDAGGIENLVEVLRKEHTVSESMLEACLNALVQFAMDGKTRQQLIATGVLQTLIKLMAHEHCEEVVVAATTLLQYCAFDTDMQDKIRCVCWCVDDDDDDDQRIFPFSIPTRETVSFVFHHIHTINTSTHQHQGKWGVGAPHTKARQPHCGACCSQSHPAHIGGVGRKQHRKPR